jgi:NAD(P)-dependent dehydrogenase (short-subunit alcohol dehydrogenase family)
VSGLTDLRGKVAVVTGGASGIGLGIATRFAAEGMHVVLADVEQQSLDRASEQLGALGVLTDVRDPDSVSALADAALGEFGAVHVVVNNAGIGPMAPIADLDLSDWRWMLEVNLFGVIHGVHSFLPVLSRNADGGHVVNTASVGGLATMPHLGAYTVSKFGIVALTETLAMELAMSGSKVGASVLIPGTVHTNINHSLRNRPQDLGNGRLADVDLASTEMGQALRWLEPEDVGRITVKGIQAGDLYIVTHPETWAAIEPRQKNIEAAFTQAAADLAKEQQ